MIKQKINKEILNRYQQKYGNEQAICGFGEEVKTLPIPLPKRFMVILDDENLTIVQIDANVEENNVERIPVSSIQAVKLIGPVIKAVHVKTAEKVVKFVIKPNIMGISKEQSTLLHRFKRHFKQYK